MLTVQMRYPWQRGQVMGVEVYGVALAAVFFKDLVAVKNAHLEEGGDVILELARSSLAEATWAAGQVAKLQRVKKAVLGSPEKIGVLCYYEEQRALVARRYPDIGAEVLTIDAAQGKTYTYVVLLTTHVAFTGYMLDPRRGNVAFTRDTRGLFVRASTDFVQYVPNSAALLRNDPDLFPAAQPPPSELTLLRHQLADLSDVAPFFALRDIPGLRKLAIATVDRDAPQPSLRDVGVGLTWRGARTLIPISTMVQEYKRAALPASVPLRALRPWSTCCRVPGAH